MKALVLRPPPPLLQQQEEEAAAQLLRAACALLLSEAATRRSLRELAGVDAWSVEELTAREVCQLMITS